MLNYEHLNLAVIMCKCHNYVLINFLLVPSLCALIILLPLFFVLIFGDMDLHGLMQIQFIHSLYDTCYLAVL